MFVQSNRHRNDTLRRRCVVPRRFVSSSGKTFRLLCLVHWQPWSLALAIPENGWLHDASWVLEQRFTDTVVVPRASPSAGAAVLSTALTITVPIVRRQGFSGEARK